MGGETEKKKYNDKSRIDRGHYNMYLYTLFLIKRAEGRVKMRISLYPYIPTAIRYAEIYVGGVRSRVCACGVYNIMQVHIIRIVHYICVIGTFYYFEIYIILNKTPFVTLHVTAVVAYR